MEIIATLVYWALFGLAVLGGLGLILSVFSGKWGLCIVCLGIMFPYVSMWVIDYGSNRFIRREVLVDAKVISVTETPDGDGRSVVLHLEPQQHVFFSQPNELAFSVFGAVDDRPVEVLSTNVLRGIDGLIKAAEVKLLVPNLGVSSIRLDYISIQGLRYHAKSPLLEFDIHYVSQ